jgi:hypothetical protein
MGSPVVPGGPVTSKPTWFSTPWVFDHVGFVFPVIEDNLADRERWTGI